jgi:hypothetical protein
VAINRSTKPRRLQVVWPSVRFTEMELVDPYHENEVRPIPSSGPGGTTEVVVEPGAIITLTNAALGRLTNDVSKHIR